MLSFNIIVFVNILLSANAYF